jgi:predicted DNA-binding protein (MmcQ/YjbR family)
LAKIGWKQENQKSLISEFEIIAIDTDFIRNICLQLPAVTEDVKWDNDLVFSVGGKMFCVVALQPPFKSSFKVPDDIFESLIDLDGFVPAPYLARAKWVCINNPHTINKNEWEKSITQSYELVKAKLPLKTRKELGL